MTMFGFPRKQVIQPVHAPTPYYFRPATYGTVSLWHRADEPAEGAVSQWNDLSGSGNHLGIVSNSSSTAWHTTRDSRKLRALISPNSFIRSAAIPATGANARSILCVYQRVPTLTLGSVVAVWSYGTNTSLQSLSLTYTSAGVYQLRSAATTTLGSVSSSSPSDTLPDVLLTTYDGTTVRVYQNGSEIIAATATLATGSTVGFTLAADVASGGINRGLYYEVAAWNTHTDATTALEISNLLQAQYRTGR